MAKEIDIDRQGITPVRLVGVSSDCLLKSGQFVLQLLDIQHGRGNTAHTARFENGRSQQVVLRSSHRCLDQSNRVRIEKRGVHGAIIPSAQAH